MISARRFAWCLIPVIWILISGCRPGIKPQDDQPLVQSLVESFDPEWLASERERFVFHDAVVKSQRLGTGWEFDEAPSETRFPWPRFTHDGGSIRLDWSLRMERRVTLKLLNIAAEYPPELIRLTVNGHPVPMLQDHLPVGEYEFYIPSSVQKTGTNEFKVTLALDQLPPDFQVHTVGLHSIRVTLGAVVRNAIQIGDQVRNSLLFAPPVGLRIPYRSDRKQHIQFSYGLFSADESDVEKVYYLKIALTGGSATRPMFERTFPIVRNEVSRGEWQFVMQKLPVFTGTGWLEISFMEDGEGGGPIDYLALSEVLIVPSNQVWELKTGAREPDVVWTTLSAVAADQLGAYGNPHARTPFLDRLAFKGSVFTDVTAAGNGEIASVLSMATGKLPRDHGVYRKAGFPKEPPRVFTELVAETSYQSHAFVYTHEPGRSIFGRLPGFKRVYLSDPSKVDLQNVRLQLNAMLASPHIAGRPGFFWFHLSPPPVTPKMIPGMFDRELYGTGELSISDLNIPVSEQDRLRALAAKNGSGEDVRDLLTGNDYRVSVLDAALSDIAGDIIRKRPMQVVSMLVTADHGLIRGLNSNILSGDSLSQEVLHIPLIWGQVNTDSRPDERKPVIAPGAISALKVFDMMTLLLRNSDLKSVTVNGTAASAIRPIIAEHDERPILAYRKDNFKMIHCLSNPYFQIATTNLFNLDDDPQESVNLVGRDPAYTQQFLDPVLAFCRGSAFYPSPRLGLEEETQEILQSLRYTVP